VLQLQASLSFTGAASGPLLGIFLLGGLFPCANWLVPALYIIFLLIDFYLEVLELKAITSSL